jgi:hypothetical protein
MIMRLAVIHCLATCLTLSPFVSGMDEVAAATQKKKKVSKKRGDFTPQQREKLMAESRHVGRK